MSHNVEMCAKEVCLFCIIFSGLDLKQFVILSSKILRDGTFVGSILPKHTRSIMDWSGREFPKDVERFSNNPIILDSSTCPSKSYSNLHNFPVNLTYRLSPFQLFRFLLRCETQTLYEELLLLADTNFDFHPCLA